MSLQFVDKSHYLNCARVHINTDERDIDRSKGNFDLIIYLRDLYERVVAMELVSWSLPYDIAPTIYPAYRDRPTNRFLDVRMQDVPLTTTLNFTVRLELAGYQTEAAFVEAVRTQIVAAMEAQGDATFNNANTVWYVNEIGGKYYFYAENGGVSNSVNVFFLFASGPSAGSSPWQTLGFATETDTQIYTTQGIRGPFTNLPLQLSPFRYVDVFVNEVSSNRALARVPLSGDDHVTTRFKKTKFRLLDSPIRRISELRARLELSNGEAPIAVSTNGFDLVFDFLQVVPKSCIPPWVQQKLMV